MTNTKYNQPRLVSNNPYPRRGASSLNTSGPSDTYGGMEDRISRLETGMARLEGAVDGLRQSQNLTLAAITLLGAFVIGFGVYFLQRADQLTTQVNALPGQISTDLKDITKTLSEGITAARQMNPPQAPVIVLPPYPSPQPQPKP